MTAAPMPCTHRDQPFAAIGEAAGKGSESKNRKADDEQQSQADDIAETPASGGEAREHQQVRIDHPV